MVNIKLLIDPSIFLVITGFLTLVWLIYKEFYFRARVSVEFYLGSIELTDSSIPTWAEDSPAVISGGVVNLTLSATNKGPGNVKITSIILKKSSFFRKLFRKVKYIWHPFGYDYFSTNEMPVEIKETNTATWSINYDQTVENLLNEYTHIGVSDSYGRKHWASRKEFKKVKKELKNLINQR